MDKKSLGLEGVTTNVCNRPVPPLCPGVDIKILSWCKNNLINHIWYWQFESMAEMYTVNMLCYLSGIFTVGIPRDSVSWL